MRRSGRFIQATKLFGAWNAPDCVKTQTQIFRWGYLCKKIQILALLWRNCAIFPQHLDIEWEIFQSRKKFFGVFTQSGTLCSLVPVRARPARKVLVPWLVSK